MGGISLLRWNTLRRDFLLDLKDDERARDGRLGPSSTSSDSTRRSSVECAAGDESLVLVVVAEDDEVMRDLDMRLRRPLPLDCLR